MNETKAPEHDNEELLKRNSNEETGKSCSTKPTKKIWVIITVLAGAALGYAWYYFIGCSSGSCPITSNPWVSTLFGAFMGLWFHYRPCKTC